MIDPRPSDVEPASPVTEADSLRLHARLRPDHPAILYHDECLSYGMLDRRANQVANALLAADLPGAARIATLSRNSREFFELVFGTMKSGHVLVPLNWRLAAPELAAIIRDAEPDLLVVDADFLPMLAKVEAETGMQCRILRFGSDDPQSGFAAWRDRAAEADPRIAVDPDGVMLQFYTSGTTGIAKGVQITHRSSLAMRRIEVESGEAWMEWGPGDVAIVALPNFHLSGTSWALQWFARGATCVVQEQVDPGAFLAAIERHRVTQLFAVPTIIQKMLDDPRRPEIDFSSLKLIYYGGAPIPAPLLQSALDAFGCGFVQIYGMTETNGIVCFLTPADHRRGSEALLQSCGRPLPAISLRILDESGRELPAGTVGEICVRTPALMKGYWNRPDANAVIMHGEHYRTGDAGYVDEAGYLFIVDRLKDMIVTGGENVYPAEIERVLQQHPGIAEIAVVGLPDPVWGEAVAAVIVPRDPAPAAEEVVALSKRNLAGYKAPKRVFFVEALPRNANGKILKRELRRMFTEPDPPPGD